MVMTVMTTRGRADRDITKWRCALDIFWYYDAHIRHIAFPFPLAFYCFVSYRIMKVTEEVALHLLDYARIS
jgi:hypothetical protein